MQEILSQFFKVSQLHSPFQLPKIFYTVYKKNWREKGSRSKSVLHKDVFQAHFYKQLSPSDFHILRDHRVPFALRVQFWTRRDDDGGAKGAPFRGLADFRAALRARSISVFLLFLHLRQNPVARNLWKIFREILQSFKLVCE